MIRAAVSVFLFLLAGSTAAFAQAQATPQTARQALIEMFLGKAPGTLEKHLPEATRTAIHNASPGSPAATLNAIALLVSQAQTQGVEWQTYDTGSILFHFENPQQHTKFDAIVVGSGMTGGWAAKELTEHGLDTLVLEVGPPVDPIQDAVEHVPTWRTPR